MKTADSSKFPSWFFIFGLVSLRSVDLSYALRETQQCVDGTYEHEGVTCCQCGAGTFVEKHCTATTPVGKCTSCREKTYNSHPHSQESCETCTSCSQLNANLELDVSCTRARDATCRCKKDHFCGSKEACILCFPCKECTEGVKVACTATNNTVCSEKTEGGNKTGLIVGLTVFFVFIIVIGLLAFFWIRNRNRNNTPEQGRNDLEILSLQEPLLKRDLPDIAEIIGWTVMKDVATRSGMLDTTIENCKLNNVGNAQEQTLELLNKFVEVKGRQAQTTLIQTLKNSGKRRIAERVVAKLNSSA